MKYPQYNGDPFPLMEEEIQQIKNSNASNRKWGKFRKLANYELERLKNRGELKKGK